MSETRKQLLQMLQDGKITADQAADLMAALEPEDALDSVNDVSDENEAVEGDVIMPRSPAPDMNRFRRFWQVPFFICLVFFTISGLWLRSIYQSSEGAISFAFVCVWSLFLLAFGLTALAFMSRRSAWLHVRVREKKGTRISVSLPLPLRLANWALTFAQGFVPESERAKIQMASEFVEAARESLKRTETEPIMINIDDDDGDRVQVFIG
ncbi:MAG: hypothetical protein GY943_09310 [Chloroflexi bacterium]|nr:hypothetical protein [Chloroflexota bacterium]